ncbi:unnamed protein product [Blumeria hordei]|uniref:Uncharacterized protein n=2 Tax=Blumeria hordei TaxID=2867405 RepID=A0A383UJC7_BLUHO|nr:CSEP0146 putative effector protein [Blumeria hordei DH14]SZF00411.1 unnamed protein product [Blumeria hordei]
MRLLPLASFIALFGHLMTVSAYNEYKCLSGVRFYKHQIHELKTQILEHRNGHQLTFVELDGDMPVYEFENQNINGVKHLYQIKVNLTTENLWVMEVINGVRHYCNPT